MLSVHVCTCQRWHQNVTLEVFGSIMIISVPYSQKIAVDPLAYSWISPELISSSARVWRACNSSRCAESIKTVTYTHACNTAHHTHTSPLNPTAPTLTPTQPTFFLSPADACKYSHANAHAQMDPRNANNVSAKFHTHFACAVWKLTTELLISFCCCWRTVTR